MSKKNKNKFKKMQKARVIQESLANQAPDTAGETKGEDIVASVVSRKTQNTAKVELKDEFLPEVSIVKKELKKVGLVFGIIIVLIAAVTIMDGKTGLVLNAADLIMKIF